MRAMIPAADSAGLMQSPCPALAPNTAVISVSTIPGWISPTATPRSLSAWLRRGAGGGAGGSPGPGWGSGALAGRAAPRAGAVRGARRQPPAAAARAGHLRFLPAMLTAVLEQR